VEDESNWHQRVATLRSGVPLLDYRTKLRAKDGDHRIIQWTTVEKRPGEMVELAPRVA